MRATARFCAGIASAAIASRCVTPVATVFEPQFDPRPALGCFTSLAPIVLALHWGTELTAARERVAKMKVKKELEYQACLRGEGCYLAYEEYKTEESLAKQKLQEVADFQIAGATRALLTQYGLPKLRSVARRTLPATMQSDDSEPDGGTEPPEAAKSTLEEKMASWEASEAEQRSSTLGGNLPLIGIPGLPGRMTRTDQPASLDGFDVGMNLSGLILFPLAIALATVPFWIGSIDVGDVGPPPTS